MQNTELHFSWLERTQSYTVLENKRFSPLEIPKLIRALLRSSVTECTSWKQPALLSPQGSADFAIFSLEQPSGHSPNGWLLPSVRTQLIYQLSHDLSKLLSPGHARCLSSEFRIITEYTTLLGFTRILYCVFIYCDASLCHKLFQDSNHVLYFSGPWSCM